MSDSGNNYAWQGSQDAGSTASEFNARQFHIDQTLAGVRTATLVQIVKAPYDANGNPITPGTPAAIGYVDVQPLVNQLDGYGNPTPHGVVYRLSYFRYQGGNGAFISDPVAGDQGKMVVADRDTSVVRSTGAQGNPGSRRKFDFADGTYFGQTQKGAPQQWFAWLSKGFSVKDAFGNTLVGTADGVVINGVTITLAGDVVNKAKVILGQHVHSDAGGTGDSGPPVPGT